MNLQDVADRLGCSVKTVRRRIDDGSLPAARVARGVWVVTEDDLSSFIGAMRVTARRPVAPIEPAVEASRTPPRARYATTRAADGRLVIPRGMGQRAPGAS